MTMPEASKWDDTTILIELEGMVCPTCGKPSSKVNTDLYPTWEHHCGYHEGEGHSFSRSLDVVIPMLCVCGTSWEYKIKIGG